MAKARTHYLCQHCGGVQSQWMGRCPDCGQWDALERYVEPKQVREGTPGSLARAWLATEPGGTAVARRAEATPLPAIESTDVSRMPTGIGELDRVLGGGFVPGSVVMLGGDPGIGKSTLLLQAAAEMARRGTHVLYVSSEESPYQTRLRSERLFAATSDAAPALGELEHLLVLAETNLGAILEQARTARPAVLVLDSIQMVYQPELDASPGSVAQLRRCCMDLVGLAKVSGMAIALVGHVTKDGKLAGPKLLEHLVDTVLSFEGDQHHAYRVVRGIKNRFGTTFEVGLFEMTGTGLAQVTNNGTLLSPEEAPPAGSVICLGLHGTRCLLVEIQALTATGFLGSAKRKTSGLDANRLAMLIAVLEQHGGLRLADQDVFASAVGGLKIVEPAADLALCLAIASAHYRKPLPAAVAVVGEVGLGGEVRPAPQIEHRLHAAARLGYRQVVMSASQKAPASSPLEAIGVRTMADALKILG